MKLKHINDLEIGDKILIDIPSVMIYTGVVSFINKDQKFVFIDGGIDDEDGIQFIPNKDGYFKVP
jgi:hypothetical protein